MKSLDRKLVRDVWRLRGQAIAIALVIACGVASFLSMRTTYHSLLVTQAAYYSDYRFADVFATLKRAPESLEARISEIPGVQAVQTRIVRDVTLDIPDLNEPATGRLVSIPETPGPMLNDLHIARGRYIEAGKTDEVIISGAFSKANNLGPGDNITAIINGRWQRLRVVGVALSPEYVYEIRVGDIFPDSRRFGVMWMSRKAIGPVFDMEGSFNDVALSLAPDANRKEVIERLDALLAPYGGLGGYEREDQVSNHFISNEIAELNVTSTFIPVIFLGVTAFLVHLVMTRLVSAQREQIAVLKAFGYGNASVGWHYLKLALLAVSGGVILGIVVGWYFGSKITALYASFFRFPILRYEANPQLIGAAILISLGAATVGALNAVRRAVNFPPAEAMRPEPPALYHAGIFEKIGLHRLLTPSWRIIFRNLVRNPVKAFFSMLGVSLSITLLVVGFYLYSDAIAYIINLQFHTVYREDVMILFNEPRPFEARYELDHLQGVLRVETFRVAPARLRFEQNSRRLAITGIERDGELFRLVSSDGTVLTPPPKGLVLTTKLAELLGVKAGQDITVEVLEGERPIKQIPVVMIVDELIGLSAYMDARALNELLNEGGTISGARLMVDKNYSNQLYTTLKNTPAVSCVRVPEAALNSFNDTMAKTIKVSTIIMIVFAYIIAFGMVYNGARIALSERGRELASLRVLGFTQGEISVMLLGEQAVLTLMAAPLGWVLGYGLCALITWAIDTEIMRLPLVISAGTYLKAFLIIASAAFFSGLLVRWRLRRLDLIAALKTRE
jgi:putative ABC transport system permease protein